MDMNKFLVSSIDPQKLSLTVKGVMVGAIPVAIFLAKMSGVELPEGDLTDLAENVGNAIQQIGVALSAIMIVYGGVRKVLVAFGVIKVN